MKNYVWISCAVVYMCYISCIVLVIYNLYKYLPRYKKKFEILAVAH